MTWPTFLRRWMAAEAVGMTARTAAAVRAASDLPRDGLAAWSARLGWSSATLAMALITLGTLAATAKMIGVHGLTFPAADAVPPLVLCGLLFAGAGYYRRQEAANFVLCLRSLGLLVAFSAAFATLTYCIAVTGRPAADHVLAQADAWLGLSAGPVVTWVKEQPALDMALTWAYFTTLPQTALAIVLLGLTFRPAALDTFLLRFMAGALIASVGFYFWPAMGSCAVFHYDVPSYHVPFAEHFTALRDGQQTVVSWKGAQGLVTFPSFHTIWAILLTAAFRRWGWWTVIVAGLNGLVIVSTVTTGMHYFVDVFVGGAIAAALCLVIRQPAESAHAA